MSLSLALRLLEMRRNNVLTDVGGLRRLLVVVHEKLHRVVSNVLAAAFVGGRL